MIVDTDPGPESADWTKVKFGTEESARKHAKFLNEEVDRKNAALQGDVH